MLYDGKNGIGYFACIAIIVVKIIIIQTRF